MSVRFLREKIAQLTNFLKRKYQNDFYRFIVVIFATVSSLLCMIIYTNSNEIMPFSNSENLVEFSTIVEKITNATALENLRLNELLFSLDQRENNQIIDSVTEEDLIDENDYGNTAKIIPKYNNKNIKKSNRRLLPKLDNSKRYQRDKTFQLSESWDALTVKSVEKIQNERVDLIRSVCTNSSTVTFREPNPKTFLWRMMWVTDYDLVYCPIFKAASTTWVTSLNNLKSKDSTSGNHRQGRDLFPMPDNEEQQRSIMKDSMRLVTVRNPLDRILSAYRDKMLRLVKTRNGKDEPYRALQKQVFKKYPDIELPDDINITNIEPPGPLQPTFNQFLQKVKEDLQYYNNALLNGQNAHINLHWRPYWAVCAPCSIDYTFIAKVETFAQDQEYIIRNRELPPKAMISQAHSSNFDSFKSTTEARLNYFRAVPRSLLEDIIQLYLTDFKLFGYSWDDHLKLSIQDL